MAVHDCLSHEVGSALNAQAAHQFRPVLLNGFDGDPEGTAIGGFLSRISAATLNS
jgi:hypothetical protein